MNFVDMKRITFGDKRAVELKIGGAVVWNGLPKGYTELEYIETSGTQYIDTGFVPNQDARVVCEFMLVENISLSGIYGARTTAASDDFSFRISANRWQPCYNNQYGTFTDIPVDTTLWHSVDHNKNEFFFDGELKTQSPFTYASFTAPKTLTIGAIANKSSMNYGKARYRAFQLYDNGELIRRYIPCKDPDGNIGMYDSVNGAFYGNAGTGTFLAGEAWNGLPYGYKQLEYIETTGAQYIDTGFRPNQDTRVVCEFMLTEIVNLGGIYGARNAVVSSDYSFRISANRWQPCYNNQYGTFTDVPVDTTEWHSVDHNKNKFYFDGNLKESSDSPLIYAEFTAPMSLTIGAIRNKSGSHHYSKARFRLFKLYDNGELIRDLIPCETKDGRIGMYDALNAVFYGNAGTGEFTAGSEL